MLIRNKTDVARNSWYLRHKETWCLEVRMAYHCLKFYVGIKRLITEQALSEKAFHYSETLFLFCGSLRRSWRTFQHIQGFSQKKISNVSALLENKQNYTRKVFGFLWSLRTNPECSSLNHYPQLMFKGGVPQEYFATPIQSGTCTEVGQVKLKETEYLCLSF